MNNNKIITVYSTSKCNLNCRYCFLSKNSSVFDLDKLLEKSFSEPKYYINLAKEYLEDEIKEITDLQIWGGETLLHLNRTFNFIEDLITESPKFSNIFLSSNFAHEKVLPSLKELMSFLEKFSDRNFILTIQISCDGPEEITDLGRGKNVTKNILKNFNKFLEENFFLKNNVQIKIVLKPTLDKETYKRFLSKDFNIFYYQFFENEFIDKIRKINNKNIVINLPTPNFAIPADFTQEDGKILKEILLLQQEIEKENEEKKYFKYFKKIELFGRVGRCSNICTDLSSRGNFCGTGLNLIGLLPEGKACGCHRCFEEFFKQYQEKFLEDEGFLNTTIKQLNPKENKSTQCLIFNNKEEFKKHIYRMKAFYGDKNEQNFSPTAIISAYSTTLQMLAHVGQVDEKYKNVNNAILAAHKILRNLPTCINENLNTTGVPHLVSNYYFKLFCNGALDLLFNNKG